MRFRKIINDPVYGFITIDDELIYQVIAHPYYQRLRRINQMAMASLVYPGAVHTRLHHSLGAYHLMCNALIELRSKGIEITPAEDQAAKIAILLHDIGHGPYSHALEDVLIEGLHHEELSLMIMKDLNRQFGGRLQLAMEIFTDQHPKKFLHQLISGQLDVDRMDYLTRDSFFSGVNEGVIGYDRIIKMLTVHQGELMVEEKAIYSIEKFLVARRLMYWQVYLHKTVLCAEQMLKRIIRRAKKIGAITPGLLNPFINEPLHTVTLDEFCRIDDHDVVTAIKTWCDHEDPILSFLCKGIINRQLLKIKYSGEPVSPELLAEKTAEACTRLNLGLEDAGWLVFTGEASSSTYNFEDEHIHILFKDGTVKDISAVDNALINQNLRGKVKKYYICYLR
ncbi:MAG: HD domain-containing protein [Chitinophagaceae bacterium]|nr:HD domain-containing protein [Chitinophagaceae bacterium]MBL0054853.1 HD domain-containing protein [Chitinophagaceae bacterium]